MFNTLTITPLSRHDIAARLAGAVLCTTLMLTLAISPILTPPSAYKPTKPSPPTIPVSMQP